MTVIFVRGCYDDWSSPPRFEFGQRPTSVYHRDKLLGEVLKKRAKCKNLLAINLIKSFY